MKSTSTSYYQQHREVLLKKRRERYWTDPDFRAQTQATARRAWQQRRKPRTSARRGRRRPQAAPKRRTVWLDGRPVSLLLYRVSDLAATLGWQQNLVSDWIRRGIIPRGRYSYPAGWPLYSKAEVLVIQRAAAACMLLPDMRNPVLRERFQTLLQRRWPQ